MAIFTKYRYKINVMSNVTTENVLNMLETRSDAIKNKKIGLLVDTLPNTSSIDRRN